MSSISSSVVISLDALDLNFLENQFEQNFGAYEIKKGLYSNDNNYYEFEIKTHEDSFEESINNEEKLEYILCHICKIDIPQQFFNEHRNSDKHKINITIANEAVQRLQNHVSCHYETNSSKIKSLNYFCPVCAITMDNTEKYTHKNSVGHKNSVIVEKFLKEFLSLYSNEAYDGNHSLKIETSTAKPSECKSIIETQIKPKTIAENQEEKSISKENVNKLNITGLSDYIIILKEKYEIQETQFKAVNEATLEITTVDKSVVQVSSDSFHGFNELTTRFTRCTICKDIFDISTRQQHLLSEYHMKSIWCLPLKNKNCIRHITDRWNHCVLCNEGIEDISSHLLTTEHLNNIKMCLLSEEKQNTLVSSDQLGNIMPTDTIQVKNTTNSFEKAINKVYNVTTDTKQEIVPVLATPSNESTLLDTELKSDKLKKVDNINEKQFCSFCNVFISIKGFQKHSNTIKHNMNTLSDFHYLMAYADTDNYVCRICDQKITNNLEDVKQHITLPNHLQKYNTLLQNNGIRQINKITFFCTPCNDIVLVRNELLHINSKGHKMLCGKDDNATVDKFLTTVPSPVEVVTSITKSDNPKAFFCNICSVNVPNTKHNIEIHIKGRAHIKNMQNLFCKKNPKAVDPMEVNEENSSNVDVNKVQINKTEQKKSIRHTNLVKTKDSSILKCIVCDVFITNNELNIATHIKGGQHKNCYNIILERNCVEINGNDIFCKTCSVPISIGNEIQHCKGKNHIQNLATAAAEIS